jgi:hypothetical protein
LGTRFESVIANYGISCLSQINPHWATASLLDWLYHCRPLFIKFILVASKASKLAFMPLFFRWWIVTKPNGTKNIKLTVTIPLSCTDLFGLSD